MKDKTKQKVYIDYLFIEIIKVYDGNATFRNGTPRTISVPKQASYNQILEAALRTFHINDDCAKYCITVPTDDGISYKYLIINFYYFFFIFIYSWW